MEQVAIIGEFKKITAKNNTVPANKAREECWQKKIFSASPTEQDAYILNCSAVITHLNVQLSKFAYIMYFLNKQSIWLIESIVRKIINRHCL